MEKNYVEKEYLDACDILKQLEKVIRKLKAKKIEEDETKTVYEYRNIVFEFNYGYPNDYAYDIGTCAVYIGKEKNGILIPIRKEN